MATKQESARPRTFGWEHCGRDPPSIGLARVATEFTIYIYISYVYIFFLFIYLYIHLLIYLLFQECFVDPVLKG